MQVAVIYPKTKKTPEKISLTRAVFQQEVNKALLTQAVRVYQLNRRQGTAHTKTRAEVQGSGRKIWRQKGTGRARHGDKYAPIFVGGGIAHGPKPKDWSRKLPKKMRRKALFSALSFRAKEGAIFVVAGLDKLKPKTKLFAAFFQDKLKFKPQQEQLLLVVKQMSADMRRGVGNIPNLTTIPVAILNAYIVLKYKKIVFTKAALQELQT